MNQKTSIINALADILDIDASKLSDTTELSSLENWDSIAVLSFIAIADEKFNTILSADKIYSSSKTIGDLIALIQVNP